jgi:ABC-type Fe3+/spermidine/putrescine transport system ATPase subunit
MKVVKMSVANQKNFFQMNNLVLGFGSTAISTGIDLALEKGEVLALLGPSGCGKSTLLNTIVGGQKPISGAVFVAGSDLADTPTHLRGVGIMFQQPFLFPHLNVFENVSYALKQQGMSKDEIFSNVEEILEVMKLGSYRNRPIAELSGGQAQRISLARSIVAKPKVLLLDEPLSALDTELRKELALEICAIIRQLGITTIFVTHDEAEAEVMSHRVFRWQWSL